MSLLIALFTLFVFGAAGYVRYLEQQERIICIAQTGNPECKR